MRERQGKEIRKWLVDAKNGEKLTGTEIAKASGVNTPLVWRTIDGKRNCRKVLRCLLAKGCPVELMDLPHDILAEIRKAA